jgi:NHL repeat
MTGRWRRVAIAAALSLGVVLALAAPASALQPLDRIGTTGGSAGQLSFPTGFDIDPSGNLFVADRSNHRVDEFDRTGAFVRAFGWDVIPGAPSEFEVCTAGTGCQVGDAFGGGTAFNSPQGIAIDAAGNLAVVDTVHHRVMEFTTQGAFIRAFGWDVVTGGPTGFEVCTVAADCKTGVTGGGAGQLANPQDIATGRDGTLLVSDTGNSRVSKFTTQGAFVRAFGFDVRPGPPVAFESCTTSCQAGVAGAAAGQLDSPLGVATDPGGRLFVAESSNNRVSEFTTQGAFVRAFGFDVVPGGAAGLESCTAGTGCKQGVAGTAAGQLDGPNGVGAGASGTVIVADSGNDRVNQYTAQRGFSRAFGWDVIPGGPAGFEVCTAATGCKVGQFGNGFGQHNFPTDIATDCRGAIYVAEESGDAVQRFGEAGTPLPPCPPGPTPTTPSNEFRFGKVKKNKRRGTAKLTIEIVEGPGELDLTTTKKVKADDEAVEGEGATEEKLAIKPKGKARKKLNKKGKAKVKAEVTYTPDGGESNTKSRKIKLKKRS